MENYVETEGFSSLCGESVYFKHCPVEDSRQGQPWVVSRLVIDTRSRACSKQIPQ
jgi:hypothetical protein